MPINARILEMIANPTGGKLSAIGRTYADGKQRERENKRADERLDMQKTSYADDMEQRSRNNDRQDSNDEFDREKYQDSQAQRSIENMYRANADERADEANSRASSANYRSSREHKIKMAGIAAKAGGAYATTIIQAVEADPSLLEDEEAMAELQKSVRDNMPKEFQDMIPEHTQGFDEIQRGLSNAIALEGKLGKKSSTFELGTIQNKKTGELFSRVKDDPWLAEQVATGEFVKYHASAGGTKADVLTKKTKGTIQENSINAAQLQDKIGNLIDIFNSGGKDKLNVFSQSKDFLSNFAEKMGIDVSDGMKSDIKAREKMQGEVNRVYTSWRKQVTGSQASKFELKELKSQAPNMNDGQTMFRQKLDSWKDHADIIAVRMKMANTQGFYSSGAVELPSGDTMPMYTNEETGESRAISSFFALGDIPTMDEFINSKLDGEFPNVGEMTAQEKRDAINKVTNEARLMGYR